MLAWGDLTQSTIDLVQVLSMVTKLICGFGIFQLLKMLHEEANVDVGEFGWGTEAIIEVKSPEEFISLPYATKRMKCSESIQSLCDGENIDLCKVLG
ncbi:hypothetical protein ACHAWF_015252 [Thalassiosira exigua]